MSLFSFLKKNKESYSLVIDIGSGSVSGAIVKFTERSGVNVIHYVREPIPYQQDISVTKHLKLMGSTLSIVAHKLRSEGFKKLSHKDKKAVSIDRAFYLFSSPWSASQTRTIKIKESKPIKLTENYLKRIIDKQEKEYKIHLSNSGRIIEKKIIQIKTNGSVIEDFYEKSTKNLEIFIFFTVVPEKVLLAVENAVAKTFNIKNIWCHSMSLAAFSTIRNHFPGEEDSLYIDISEEMTDISIIRNNIIETSASIPLGRNHFMRLLIKNLKVSEEIADSMIRMHCLKNNNELAGLKIAVAMDQVAQDWLSAVLKVMDNLNQEDIPNSVFFITTSDLTLFLKSKLQKQDFRLISIESKIAKTPLVESYMAFKLELMFLDNLYNI